MLRFRMHFQTLEATACGIERQCSVFRCIFCPLNGNAPFFEAFLRLVDVYLAVAGVFFRRLGWVAMLRFIHIFSSKIFWREDALCFLCIMYRIVHWFNYIYSVENIIGNSYKYYFHYFHVMKTCFCVEDES